MFVTGTHIPEQPHVPPMPACTMAAEIDRLYLEKCQEINHLRERFKIAIEQKIKLREELNKVKAELKELKAASTGDLISREKALGALEEGSRSIIAFPSVLSLSDVEKIVSDYNERYEKIEELIKAIPAASTIRELAAAPLTGFIPDVAEPEPLPESLMEELPVWTLQTVSTQDILCLSSALKNLHDINANGEIYDKLSDLMDRLIDTYCKE